jgi:hypothetical protein
MARRRRATRAFVASVPMDLMSKLAKTRLSPWRPPRIGAINGP